MAQTDDKPTPLKPEMRWLATTLGSGVKVQPDEDGVGNSLVWHDARGRRWTFAVHQRADTGVEEAPCATEKAGWKVREAARAALASSLETLERLVPRLAASLSATEQRHDDRRAPAALDKTTPSSSRACALDATELLVSTDWLAENLSDPSIAVAEVDENPDRLDGRCIPGAVRLPVVAEALESQMLADSPTLERLLADNGVEADTTLVLYGQSNNWSVAHAYCSSGRAAGAASGSSTAGARSGWARNAACWARLTARSPTQGFSSGRRAWCRRSP